MEREHFLTVIQWGGLASIIAGILRGINSLLPTSMPTATLASLYLITDIFILLGMMGLYGFQERASGLWGFLGWLLSIGGIGIIRYGAIAGANLYSAGALLFAAGLILFAVGSWLANQLPRWVSVVWILSTIVGICGYFVPGLKQLFVISGLMFGIGFSAAGLKVWSATSKQLKREIST